MDKDKENVGNINKEQMKIEDDDGKLKGFGVRHQQCLILFFCMTTAYSMRSCMGIALVAMVESIDYETSSNSSIDTTINLINETNLAINYTQGLVDTNNVTNQSASLTQNNIDENVTKVFKTHGFFNALLFAPPYPKFNWDKRHQDVILSSFQWGYMILQIPAGQLAHRFGSRYMLAGSLFINCITSFSIPWAAYYGGLVLTVMCRVVQGLSQACIVPGTHTFFGKWAPLEERARLAGFTLGGQALGTVLGLPITGFLAASETIGWPGIFRFYGLLSGLVGVLLLLLVADTPAQHPKISIAERRYIEEGLGQREGESQKHLPVPWSRILRSRGLYAIVIAHIGQTWGQIILYAEVPAFMANVMGVNIKNNGLLTALPFLVMWITNFFFSWLTDMLIVKKIMTVTNARKFANSVGFVPASIGLIVLAFVPKDIYVVESVLIGICAFQISAHVGFQVNHIDISPNFAGTMMSLSNFVSNLVAALAPIVAGFILTDVKDEYLWRKVFFVAAGLYFFTNLVYVVLGTAEQAEWNSPRQETRRDGERRDETRPMIDKTRSMSKTSY